MKFFRVFLQTGFVPAMALFIFLLWGSCKKDSLSISDPLGESITDLTGKNGAFARWRLESMYVNQVLQPLPSAGSPYYKIYQLGGAYQDGDGLRGRWNMLSKDSLLEIITNTSSGSYAKQGYRIVELSDTQLKLSYRSLASVPVLLNFIPEK